MSHETVFKQAEGLVKQFLRGKNCTVAAYGASGSGKTHMILGDSFYDNLMNDDQEIAILRESHRTLNKRVIPATTPKKTRMAQQQQDSPSFTILPIIK